jgi:hypothetical protein
VPQRLFTVEEAGEALEEVRPLAEQMVEHRRALAEAMERQEQLQARIGGNGGLLSPADLAEAQETVEREAAGVAICIERINRAGAIVKDVDDGLVDFPSLRDGEEVLLCWRVGEDEIGWWHRPDDGFAGRRPL